MTDVFAEMIKASMDKEAISARDPDRALKAAEAKRKREMIEETKQKKRLLDLESKILRNKGQELSNQIKSKRLENNNKGSGIFGTMGAMMGGNLLAKAIMKSIAQSRILNTTLSAINKALGLLMDVILLPFLPAIAFGLIMLFKAIMGFGTSWKKMIDEGPLGVLMFKLKHGTDEIDPFTQSLIDILMNPDKNVGQKFVEFSIRMLDFITNIPGISIHKDAILKFLDTIFGKGTAQDLVVNISASFFEGISDTIKKLLEFIFGSNERNMHMVLDILPQVKAPDLSNLGGQVQSGTTNVVNNFNVGMNAAMQDPASFFNYVVNQFRQEQWRSG